MNVLWIRICICCICACRRCACTRQLATLSSLYTKWSHGGRLENIASYLKSDSVGRCVLFYSKNNLAKFHLDPIWNDGASGFFEERRPNKNKQDATLSQGVPRDAAVNFGTYRSFQWHRAVNSKMCQLIVILYGISSYPKNRIGTCGKATFAPYHSSWI